MKQIEALLTSLGYKPWISDRGSLPLKPGGTAFDACLAAVARCDVFLGIIRGYYGTGRIGAEPSITHQEIRAAIQLDKVRFMAVEREVAIAREVLKPFRTYSEGPLAGKPKPHTEFNFKGNAILSDFRVIEMYEEAMRLDQPDYKDRRDNWVQEYADESELLSFVADQLTDRSAIEEEVARRKGGV